MKHDWEYKKLGEVVQYFTGNRPSGGVCQIKEGALSLGGEHIGKDGYIDLSTAKYVPQDFYTVNTKGHIFDGDVLMCKDGALTGKVALVRNELNGLCSMVNEHVFILRSVSMTHPYLFYFLFSNNGQTQIKNRISGAAQGGLNSTNLKSIQIPVPSLPTQQSIVSELDSLSKIIADCKETLKDYDALEQSIFYDMFGDPVKNEKGWEVKKLGDICIKITDGTHDTPERLTEGVKFITGKHIRPGVIDYDNSDYVDEDTHKEIYSRCNPEYGDVLYTNIGANLANAAVNTVSYEFSMKNVALFKPQKNILDGVYLQFFLNDYKIKDRIIENYANGGAQSFLSLKALKTLPIVLPHLTLQQQFASKIEAIEQMKEETKKALQEAETLFNARMDYWFN